MKRLSAGYFNDKVGTVSSCPRGNEPYTQSAWAQQLAHPTGLLQFNIALIMLYRFAAEAVLLFHLAFIVFVLVGATLAARRRWVAVVHLPAAAWGCFVELSGRICPLTYAENFLRARAGELGYTESFVEHYLLAVIYPAGLTREVQFVFAAVVVVINVAIYAWLFYPRRAAK